MVTIDIRKLQPKIVAYVKEYYAKETKPQINELDKSISWIKDMIKQLVEYVIIDHELSNIHRVITQDSYFGSMYQPNMEPTSCVTKKGYKIVKRFSEYSNKFMLENNKAAKVSRIYLWDYKMKNEMRSIIQNEFAISKKAEKLGVGPKVHDAFICLNTKENVAFKVVISDYIEGIPLNDWLARSPSSKEKARVKAIVKTKIDKLHEAGIVHNGLAWSGNVILKVHPKTSKVTDAFITDYVKAFDFKDKSMWEYNKLISNDRSVLDSITQSSYSYSNADDVVAYTAQRLIENKDIVVKL